MLLISSFVSLISEHFSSICVFNILSQFIKHDILGLLDVFLTTSPLLLEFLIELNFIIGWRGATRWLTNKLLVTQKPKLFLKSFTIFEKILFFSSELAFVNGFDFSLFVCAPHSHVMVKRCIRRFIVNYNQTVILLLNAVYGKLDQILSWFWLKVFVMINSGLNLFWTLDMDTSLVLDVTS